MLILYHGWTDIQRLEILEKHDENVINIQMIITFVFDIPTLHPSFCLINYLEHLLIYGMEVIIEAVLLVIEITLNYGDLISLHNQLNSPEHKISCMRYNNHKPQNNT